MFSLNAEKFIASLDALSTLGQCLADADEYDIDTTHLVDVGDTSRAHARQLFDYLVEMEAPVAAKAAEKLITYLRGKQVAPEMTQRIIRDVHERMKDELSSRILLHIPVNRVNYYTQEDPLWGPEFQSRFQSTATDLDEAAKCFALGRYTASVFHLMRIMEIGLHAITICLSASNSFVGQDRNWGTILKLVREARNERGNRWAEVNLFAELYAMLDAVKNAWRNGTMHVEKTYTEEEAMNVMNAVKGFMQKIASRMDENGLPLA